VGHGLTGEGVVHELLRHRVHLLPPNIGPDVPLTLI